MYREHAHPYLKNLLRQFVASMDVYPHVKTDSTLGQLLNKKDSWKIYDGKSITNIFIKHS